MPAYNCKNCNQKHGPNDACGRGERTTRKNLRAPVFEFSQFDGVWA